MGNGTTTEFFFNFPYFENSNIVVTVNNAPAPAYNVIGTPAGSGADIPFNGGKVVFDVAPATVDSIVIARNLPLARPVDYQPTAKIDATTLNQDFNYLIEVIKDRKDELNNLYNQYSDHTVGANFGDSRRNCGGQRTNTGTGRYVTYSRQHCDITNNRCKSTVMVRYARNQICKSGHRKQRNIYRPRKWLYLVAGGPNI